MALPPICTGPGVLAGCWSPVLPAPVLDGISTSRGVRLSFLGLQLCFSEAHRKVNSVRLPVRTGGSWLRDATGATWNATKTPHLVARVRRDGAKPGGFQRPTSDTVCGRFRNGPSSAAREEAVLFSRDPTEDLDSVGGAGKAENSRLVAGVDQRSWSSCVIVSNYPS
jgi:hypothetical protein